MDKIEGVIDIKLAVIWGCRCGNLFFFFLSLIALFVVGMVGFRVSG